MMNRIQKKKKSEREREIFEERSFQAEEITSANKRKGQALVRNTKKSLESEKYSQ